MGIFDKFKALLSGEEESDDVVRACDRCGFDQPEHSMVIAGEHLLCGECNDLRKKEIADLEFKKKQAEIIERIKYYCYDCKFHFTRKKDFPLRLCPNCSSENFVEEGTLL